jgi:hypothetical protein
MLSSINEKKRFRIMKTNDRTINPLDLTSGFNTQLKFTNDCLEQSFYLHVFNNSPSSI